ncbi:beta-galactosidase small subunit-related protein [Chryseobacterium caseinilyticum]|uniref:beta-galactosidase n=1 Tax=Chryseobacterium caseinilyticum TaxID=2771428 RepID=A0ABR8Z6X7_9FLAO|nr:hypothetical protein [Chryseobacterium caseinilyticum]MBD8081049.1 hypothetical protein [Chryseobacterium caseinilyticum]
MLATVNYAVNSQNNFTTNYRYTITADGKLNVHYSILPNVTVPSVPIVGMQMESIPTLKNLHWLGLGPFDSYPNKRSAPILGIWGGSATGEETSGNKAIRWVEQSGTIGGVHVSTLGYLEHHVSSPQKILLFSGVLGRPEKRP